VLERYRALCYSHQREYALWIEAAKQAETRQRRIEKSVAALRDQKAAEKLAPK